MVKRLMILFIVCLLVSVTSRATNLRGQVIRFNPNSQSYFPLVNVRVDLWTWNGSIWVDQSYAVTGNDGMYYFLNFPPFAVFRIQVLGNFFPEQPLTIANILPSNYQDIPQIIT